MSTVLEKPKSLSSRFSGFRPSPRLVRGVDLAGQWAAPILCVVVGVALLVSILFGLQEIDRAGRIGPCLK